MGGITIGAESLSLTGIGAGGSGALYNAIDDNTFGGAITLTGDTRIHSDAGSLTLSGPSLTLGGHALTFAGAGDITLAIALGGADGFTKTGDGTLTLGAQVNTTGTVTLAGGTLDLGGLAQTIGTLEVTGDSILDFSGTSTLSLNQLSVADGVILTVANWLDAVDFFSSVNNPGAANLARIQFVDFSTDDTRWLSFDQQVTPVPEPSTYGVVMLGAVLGLYGCRRGRSTSRS